MASEVTFNEFKQEWLTEVREGDPTTVELGYRFARKLLNQWLQLNDLDADLIHCDGSQDGGIDIAFLLNAESEEIEADGQQIGGDTWYLVQSKYGSAFAGENTIVEEGRKVIDTLDAKRTRLSSLSIDVLQRILNFREAASDRDRIVLLFAKEDQYSDSELRAIEDIRVLGRARIGAIFDVQCVSIYDIWQGRLDGQFAPRVGIPLNGQLEVSGSDADLLVGTVKLLDLYGFLDTYRKTTGDLDQLYEKNVRRFLGGKGKVNKGIQKTLRDHPERFGLYNNGITIIVSGFQQNTENNSLVLIDPYIVNGCQTTRTLWEVLDAKLNSGGTGQNANLEVWKEAAKQGVVITKVVKVDEGDDALLQNITTFTNSQNGIREKDFLALRKSLKDLADQMASKYRVFLEIQRGGWDSQRAYQKQHPDYPQYKESANAFDLIKVYASGWLGEAGQAFNVNSPFLPNGAIFRRLMEDGRPLDVDDFYAAYLLYRTSRELGFGLGKTSSRRQTRYTFYLIVVALLQGNLREPQYDEVTPQEVTRVIIDLHDSGDRSGWDELINSAVQLIDEYMTKGTDNCIYSESAYDEQFNGNLNAFLKWSKFGDPQSTPKIHRLLGDYLRFMRKSKPGEQSSREIILGVLDQ